MKPNPKGKYAEEYAADMLVRAGYTVLCKNYSTRCGEIDLIVRDTGTIAFVEVKARKKDSMVCGEQAVTSAKQRKLITAALLYLQEHPCDLQPRFDVISIVTDSAGKVFSFDHLTGAFDCACYPNL